MTFLKANKTPVSISLDRPVEIELDGRKQTTRSLFIRRGRVVQVDDAILNHSMVKDFLGTGALVVRSKLTPDEAREFEAQAKTAAKKVATPAKTSDEKPAQTGGAQTPKAGNAAQSESKSSDAKTAQA